MRSFLIVLGWFFMGLWWMPSAWAALTQAQYNAHVRQMVGRALQTGLSEPCDLVAWVIDYGRQGVEQREAAVRMVKELYQIEIGVNPTQDALTRHAFKHWLDDCVGGEGFEP